MKQFQLDIITPTSIETYENVSYLRIPSLDGLTGVQSRHATAIIALDIGEIKITTNNNEKIYSTSGGFADIKPEGVQLLLETIESKTSIDKDRAKKAVERASKHLKNPEMNIPRAEIALRKAKNRLKILNK